MALPIRGIPVLEGETARRFIKEAKENEKKRGSIKIPDAAKILVRQANEDLKRYYEREQEAKSNS